MVNRFEPQLPAAAMKTYELRSPLATHWRDATCAEVDCAHYLGGWQVRVEGLPPELLHTARTSGRRFRELRAAEGETYLVFEAGQPCFRASAHRLPLDRPEFYFVRGGDWRGNPRREGRQHANAADWVDDFANHQDKLATEAQKG
jgi:hypothetical protein